MFFKKSKRVDRTRVKFENTVRLNFSRNVLQFNI